MIYRHDLYLTQFELLCFLPNNAVLDEDWLYAVLVLHTQPADHGGEDLTNISDDRQGEWNTNNGKEDTKEAARESDRCNVPIANSGQDGGGEEDCL